MSSLFGVHREGAKVCEPHPLETYTLQGGEGIEHPKEVVEVPKCSVEDEEASDSCESREKQWKAGMKREMLQGRGPSGPLWGLDGLQFGRHRIPAHVVGNIGDRELSKLGKLPMEYDREQGERVRCGVVGVPHEYDFADEVA